MRMSSGALAQTTAGQVVNLLSNDVNRFDYAFIYTHFIWLLPLQVLVVCYLIYIKIGYAAIVGVIGIVLQTIPVQCEFCNLLLCTFNYKNSKQTNYDRDSVVSKCTAFIKSKSRAFCLFLA